MATKRLTIPTIQLSGEQDKIRTALHQATEGQIRAVFVEGAAGTGKSTLVRDTLTAATSRGKTPSTNYVRASTKYDQCKANSSLNGLNRLINSLLLNSIENLGDECYKALRAELSKPQLEILQVYGSCTLPMEYMDTECEDEIGNTKPENEISMPFNLLSPLPSIDTVSKESIIVLGDALKATMKALSGLATLILVLDDVHWGCHLTMQLLHHMLTGQHLKNILVCATLRSNEPTASGGFYTWKQKLEQEVQASSLKLQAIILQDLPLMKIQELLSDTVSQDMDSVLELAETIHSFTHGNMFFTKHFLEKLHDEQLLTFDFHSYQWKWSVDEIKGRSSISDNVLQMLSSRIYRLSESVKNVLILASCFGAFFDSRALEATKSTLGIEDVGEALQEAQQMEFVIKLETNQQFKFAHDIIQITAYNMLPEQTGLESIHWKIGSLLLKETTLLESDSIFFAMIDNLNLADVGWSSSGADLTTLKSHVAEANYKAACMAATLSSYAPAVIYAKSGLTCLGADSFKCNYNLAMRLNILLANSEHATGNLESCLKTAQVILDNANSLEEKIPAFLVTIDCYMSKSEMRKVIEVGLDILSQLGERIPHKPNPIKVQFKLQCMKAKVQIMSDEDILSLPLQVDTKIDAILKIYVSVLSAAYMAGENNLFNVAVSDAVQLSMKHGLSLEGSPFAFLLAGACIVNQSKNVKEGYRLGNVAEKIGHLAKGGRLETTKASTLVGTMTKWWMEPLSNCLEGYISTHKNAMKHGDLIQAFQSTVNYAITYFYAGLPLGPLLEDVERFCNQYLEYNQRVFFFLGSPTWQLLLNLMNKSKDAGSMDVGEVIEKRKVIDSTNRIGGQTIQAYQMILSYYLGDLPRATKEAEALSKADLGAMATAFWAFSRRFFFGLIAIANFRLTNKRRYKQQAEQQIKIFRAFVKEGGGMNLCHKLQLLEAEMLSLKAKKSEKLLEEVFAKYNDAIVSSTRAGFLQDAALGNYLCFQFTHLTKTKTNLSEMYLKQAYEKWMEWGAVAVAMSLQHRHHEIFRDSDSLRESLLGGSGRNVNAGCHHRGRARFDASLAEQHKVLNIQATSAT